MSSTQYPTTSQIIGEVVRYVNGKAHDDHLISAVTDIRSRKRRPSCGLLSSCGCFAELPIAPEPPKGSMILSIMLRMKAC